MRLSLSLVLLLVGCRCTPRPSQVFVAVNTVDASVPDASVPIDAGVVCAPTCATFGNPRVLGEVLDPLNELSGLVASRSQPGVLFAHNDSGDTARFFAISALTGSVQQEFLVQSASNRDWEDIALGPCSSGTCLFLGDIGDNARVRTDYALYVVPEPMVTSGAMMMNVPSQKLPYDYPMGEKHNAEALLVDPHSGRPYIVTKEPNGQSSFVYRFPMPLTPGVSATLELVTTLTVPGPTDLQLTGADVSPCGDAVLLRMYNRLVVQRGDGGVESAFAGAPTNVPVAQEAQGEAVAFAADGRSYFTASETITDPPSLNQSLCR